MYLKWGLLHWRTNKSFMWGMSYMQYFLQWSGRILSGLWKDCRILFLCLDGKWACPDTKIELSSLWLIVSLWRRKGCVLKSWSSSIAGQWSNEGKSSSEYLSLIYIEGPIIKWEVSIHSLCKLSVGINGLTYFWSN